MNYFASRILAFAGRAKTWLGLLLLGLALQLTGAAAAPPIVTVTVNATESKGNPLKYEWRVTDGKILSASGAVMKWQLPPGKGLHFAYVLVSNGKGGYIERRAVVSTDTIGSPLPTVPVANFSAPAAPVATGNPYTSILRGGYYTSPFPNGGDLSNGVYTPRAEGFLDNGAGFTTQTVKADRRGYFTIQGVPNGTYNLKCRLDGNLPFEVCSDPLPINGQAVLDPYQGPQSGHSDITGRLLLANGQPCGIVNEFFNKKVGGSAVLVDATGNTLGLTTQVNAYGHYSFGANSAATGIRLKCEGAGVVTIPVPAPTDPLSPRTLLSDTTTPRVISMVARFNGTIVGKLLPPPSGVPSDKVAGTDFFLTFKGIDSRLSACRYYLAIGAVKTCTASGAFTGAITFKDWKKKTHMAPFLKPGAREAVATYINKVDLNLTRKHHAVSYGTKETAAYVCNHLGPDGPTQAAANIAIQNAVQGRNLVACVAMDYTVAPGVNGNRPFVRFLIFGPDGTLLPSVNLDGRGEKFVPGTCVACHGGDHYAGTFPTASFTSAGAGSADIGAHFLPYDIGNFVFSTVPSLKQAAQEESIFKLNQIALRAGPNIAIKELIRGWYATSHVQNHNYLPASWAAKSAIAKTFYKKVYASGCRSCHVAMNEELNFDHYANFDTSSATVFEDGRLRTGISVCYGSSSWLRTYSMPNSLQTMNLFWESATAGPSANQPDITAAFIADLPGGTPEPCILRKMPLP